VPKSAQKWPSAILFLELGLDLEQPFFQLTQMDTLLRQASRLLIRVISVIRGEPKTEWPTAIFVSFFRLRLSEVN